jgi:hypothetical protein
MSGLKCSKIQLEKERKACQEALGRISIVTGSIEGLREKVRAILNKIPVGVKESFPEESQKIKGWLSKEIPAPSKGMNSTQLNKLAEELQRMNKKGQEALHLLIEIKEVRREARARELIEKLERLRAELEGTQRLLNKWRPGEYENIISSLDKLPSIIESGEFVEVERELNQSEKTLIQLRQEVTSLEDQDTQRRYVLKALRDVCKEEMGWGEEKEPALKDSSNPGSPLIYEVETYYAGKISFRLTLEEINVHSPISTEEGLCYKEFDNLSERLKRFGVITKFERIEVPDEEPKLIQRGELDLPDEAIEIEKEG